MATDKEVQLKVPTPGQSQYVKTFQACYPFADKLIFRPGYLNGVPNVVKLKYLHIYMVTSADVGNRTILPTITLTHDKESSGSVLFRATTASIAASKAARLVLADFDLNTLSGLTIDYQADVEAFGSLGEMILSGNDKITIVTAGVFAADSYEIRIVTEYLNNKQGITEI